MTIRGWPHLTLLCIAVLAFFGAAIRLAPLMPALLAPLIFIAIIIVALVVVALVVMVPAAHLCDRAWKRIDWRRWHANRAVKYEQSKRRETKSELAKADTEIVRLLRERQDLDVQIAELSRDLNEAYKQIRSLREQQGRG